MPVERQSEYETIYIMRPSAGEQDKTDLRERVESIVSETGGHKLRFDDWGNRRLAYRIRDRVEMRHHEQGVYQYMRYLAPGDTVAELERNLRILDAVLKFITVRVDDDIVPAERLNQSGEEE